MDWLVTWMSRASGTVHVTPPARVHLGIGATRGTVVPYKGVRGGGGREREIIVREIMALNNTKNEE